MQIGLLGILGLIFVTLKLTGYIAWSWWLVLLPFYGCLALVIAVYVAAIGIIAAVNAGSKRRR